MLCFLCDLRLLYYINIIIGGQFIENAAARFSVITLASVEVELFADCFLTRRFGFGCWAVENSPSQYEYVVRIGWLRLLGGEARALP